MSLFLLMDEHPMTLQELMKTLVENQGPKVCREGGGGRVREARREEVLVLRGDRVVKPHLPTAPEGDAVVPRSPERSGVPELTQRGPQRPEAGQPAHR